MTQIYYSWLKIIVRRLRIRIKPIGLEFFRDPKAYQPIAIPVLVEGGHNFRIENAIHKDRELRYTFSIHESP